MMRDTNEIPYHAKYMNEGCLRHQHAAISPRNVLRSAEARAAARLSPTPFHRYASYGTLPGTPNAYALSAESAQRDSKYACSIA